MVRYLSHDKRPYVILNAAMTLDGKIATKTGNSRDISTLEDWIRVHRLRSKVDAVMVGIGTVIKDDPRLTVRYVKGKSPVKVVVDSKARTPINARLFKTKPRVPVIICVSSNAPLSRMRKLEKAGAKVITCGKGNRVSLRDMMKKLRDMGIRKVLLEGGSTLNWSMIRERLVDEIHVSIAPIVVGGNKAKTLAGGEGVKLVKEGIKFELKSFKKLKGMVVASYRYKG